MKRWLSWSKSPESSEASDYFSAHEWTPDPDKKTVSWNNETFEQVRMFDNSRDKINLIQVVPSIGRRRKHDIILELRMSIPIRDEPSPLKTPPRNKDLFISPRNIDTEFSSEMGRIGRIVDRQAYGVSKYRLLDKAPSKFDISALPSNNEIRATFMKNPDISPILEKYDNLRLLSLKLHRSNTQNQENLRVDSPVNKLAESIYQNLKELKEDTSPESLVEGMGIAVSSDEKGRYTDHDKQVEDAVNRFGGKRVECGKMVKKYEIQPLFPLKSMMDAMRMLDEKYVVKEDIEIDFGSDEESDDPVICIGSEEYSKDIPNFYIPMVMTLSDVIAEQDALFESTEPATYSPKSTRKVMFKGIDTDGDLTQIKLFSSGSPPGFLLTGDSVEEYEEVVDISPVITMSDDLSISEDDSLYSPRIEETGEKLLESLDLEKLDQDLKNIGLEAIDWSPVLESSESEQVELGIINITAGYIQEEDSVGEDRRNSNDSSLSSADGFSDGEAHYSPTRQSPTQADKKKEKFRGWIKKDAADYSSQSSLSSPEGFSDVDDFNDKVITITGVFNVTPQSKCIGQENVQTPEDMTELEVPKDNKTMIVTSKPIFELKELIHEELKSKVSRGSEESASCLSTPTSATSNSSSTSVSTLSILSGKLLEELTISFGSPTPPPTISTPTITTGLRLDHFGLPILTPTSQPTIASPEKFGLFEEFKDFFIPFLREPTTTSSFWDNLNLVSPDSNSTSQTTISCEVQG